jgi:hypothetical protein
MAQIKNGVLVQVSPEDIGIDGKFVIPHGVTSIGNHAFWGCTGLTDITIPNSVTSIGARAFNRCTGLTSITIPNSVTSIGNYAFEVCTSLTSITIPNSVTSIGDSAFWGCTGLTDITIRNSVTSIGNFAFGGCTNLTSITIPNSVTSIGAWAFSNCTGLTDITIPNSVTSIGERAFWSCTGLTSITIPNSVTSIGERAFDGCDQLEAVVIDSDNESDVERIKGLLPANLQSKVVSLVEMQEKKAYRNSKLNDALVEERLMPIQAIALGRKGNDAAFVPGIISQFFGAKTTPAIELKKQLGAISLTLAPNEYRAKVDNVISSFMKSSEKNVQTGVESREAEAPSCSAVRQSL